MPLNYNLSYLLLRKLYPHFALLSIDIDTLLC